jgi:hypothetical protein
MGGGLMQLVAQGAQDVYLTGNPQITFFKVVYRRHTNFSIECVEQTFNGSIGTGVSTVDTIISRNGDLVGNMHFDLKLAAKATAVNAGVGSYCNWTNNTGHAFIDTIQIDIGGQRIDKHYGHWLDIWNELTDREKNERPLTNKHSDKNAYLKSNATDDIPELQMYIPLKFWFNRNPGLALPLIALQYHEVKIKITTRAINTLINTDFTNIDYTEPPTCTLWVDYIYLDNDERRRFAQVSHEYLIEQLQYHETTMATKIKLNINHPVKEIIWTVQDDTVSQSAITTSDASVNVQGTMAQNNDYFNYSGSANIANLNETVNSALSFEGFGFAKLLLNGNDRFAKRRASYFRTLQPVQAGHTIPEKHIYSYSFALKPEEHQPSGACNFSRIDIATMNFETIQTDSTFRMYAINYNVLRIMSGMGGLAYSN